MVSIEQCYGIESGESSALGGMSQLSIPSININYGELVDI